MFIVLRSDIRTGRILQTADFHNEAVAQAIADGWSRQRPVTSGAQKVTVFPAVSRY